MQINLSMNYLRVENYKKRNILTQKWTFWHGNVDILAQERHWHASWIYEK